MSARQVYILDCDAPGCDELFMAAEEFDRAVPTREAARSIGWRHVVVQLAKQGPAPSIDLCPAHADVDPRDALARSLARKGTRAR